MDIRQTKEGYNVLTKDEFKARCVTLFTLFYPNVAAQMEVEQLRAQRQEVLSESEQLRRKMVFNEHSAELFRLLRCQPKLDKQAELQQIKKRF